jgi:alkylation response protein AidB-like acyl-CoA dehydrogenase
VSLTTSVVTLVPPGVSVVANVPEQQLGTLHTGQQVNFTLSAYPGTTFQGTVSTISPTINAQTRTVPVQVQPTNDQGQLRGGMLANLTIVTARAEDVLTVPRTSLINSGAAGSGQPSSVWVIDTVGLKGTGSKTIVLNDVFVPERRTVSNKDIEDGAGPGRKVNTHPMYGAISSGNFTAAMAAPAVGAARGFLAAYEERLRSKTSNVDDGLTINMSRYAQAVAQIDAVHAMSLQNAQRYALVPARNVTPEDRAKCPRDQAFTAQTLRKTVNSLYEECGGSGLFDKSDFQRLWRDSNAAAADHGLTWDWVPVAWTR